MQHENKHRNEVERRSKQSCASCNQTHCKTHLWKFYESENISQLVSLWQIPTSKSKDRRGIARVGSGGHVYLGLDGQKVSSKHHWARGRVRNILGLLWSILTATHAYRTFINRLRSIPWNRRLNKSSWLHLSQKEILFCNFMTTIWLHFFQGKGLKSSYVNQGSANTGPRPGAGPWINCYRPCGIKAKLVNKLLETTDIRNTLRVPLTTKIRTGRNILLRQRKPRSFTESVPWWLTSCNKFERAKHSFFYWGPVPKIITVWNWSAVRKRLPTPNVNWWYFWLIISIWAM